MASPRYGSMGSEARSLGIVAEGAENKMGVDWASAPSLSGSGEISGEVWPTRDNCGSRAFRMKVSEVTSSVSWAMFSSPDSEKTEWAPAIAFMEK
jgi:hypothetical protein